MAVLLAATDKPDQVKKWLQENGFDETIQGGLATFSGSDLYDLSKEDAKELIGAANGIRLFNRVKKEKEARAAAAQVTAPVEQKQPEKQAEAKQPPPEQKPAEHVKPADPPVVKPADNPAALATEDQPGMNGTAPTATVSPTPTAVAAVAATEENKAPPSTPIKTDDKPGDTTVMSPQSPASPTNSSSEPPDNEAVASMKKGMTCKRHDFEPGGETKIISADIFIFYTQDDKDAGKLGSIYWCEPGKRDPILAQRLRVIDISDIYAGKQHKILESQASLDDTRCFSLEGRNASLHLEAASEPEANTWLDGLQFILTSLGSTVVVADEAEQQAAAAAQAQAQQQAAAATAAITAAAPLPAAVQTSNLSSTGGDSSPNTPTAAPGHNRASSASQPSTTATVIVTGATGSSASLQPIPEHQRAPSTSQGQTLSVSALLGNSDGTHSNKSSKVSRSERDSHSDRDSRNDSRYDGKDLIREGWLYELSKEKQWVKRRFKLLSDVLQGYEENKPAEVVSTISLRGAQVVPEMTPNGKDVVFLLTPKNDASKIYAASGKDDRTKWVDALQRQISDCTPKDSEIKNRMHRQRSVVAPSTPTRQGFLWKLGGTVKNWQKRYFKLVGQTLEYYATVENPDKKQPPTIGSRSGVIVLPDAKLSIVNNNQFGRNNLFGITPAGSKRTYIFEAASPEDREGWLKALKIHVRYGIEEGSIKEGYMLKMGGSIKTWKLRYFILTKDRLKYYKAPGDKKEKGDVQLQKNALLSAESDEAYGKPFAFTVLPVGSKRKYAFSCTDDSNRQDWVSAIKSVLDGSAFAEDRN